MIEMLDVNQPARRVYANLALVCSLAALLVLVGGFAQGFDEDRAQLYNQLAYLIDGQPQPADDNVRFMSSNNNNNHHQQDDPSDDDLISEAPELSSDRLLRNEVYLLEDKDYPRSLFEDYPRRVGQVSGITTLANNDVAIFHRSQRHWNATTFENNNNTIQASLQGDLLTNDTIMIINGEDGSATRSFGANLFYMPHSVAADSEGNLWLSDVARHQVMRLPAVAWKQQQQQNDNEDYKRTIWPDIILGEAFVPGQDEAHFCQPAELVVSSNGRLVYVADGYCNSRVVVYTGAGQRLAAIGLEQNMSVVHSLALIEERNLLCVADRENGRILCFQAGLDSANPFDSLGSLELEVKYPLGRVFALAALSSDHLLVSSNEANTNRYDLAILNPFTSELKLVWTSSDLLEPHSLAVTRDRLAAYAADISRDAYKKVFKFNIIQRLD